MGKCSKCQRPIAGHPKPTGDQCQLMPVLEPEDINGATSDHVLSANASGVVDGTKQKFDLLSEDKTGSHIGDLVDENQVMEETVKGLSGQVQTLTQLVSSMQITMKAMQDSQAQLLSNMPLQNQSLVPSPGAHPLSLPPPMTPIIAVSPTRTN